MTQSIFYVEDNVADMMLVVRELSKIAPDVNVEHVDDGLDAWAQLGAMDEDALPTLVLLDVNLPRLSGLEILERMQQSDLLRPVPVVMMSSSDMASEVSFAYEHGANAYLVKPLDLKGLRKRLDALVRFWFSEVEFDGA